MSNLDYLIIVLASAFSALVQMEIYSKLVNDKLFKIDIRVILITIVCGILITINTYKNVSYSRPSINFIIMLIAETIYFKDNLSKTILYTLFCFLIMIIYEIILSCFVQFYFKDISTFDTNILFKVTFSLLSVGFTFLSCNFKFIKKIRKDILPKLLNSKIIIIVSAISLLVLYLIDVKYSFDLNDTTYLINSIIVIGVFILLIINIYNYYKINKEIEKTEILLNFMSKYEKIIDDNRINKHEILNNLLILKSFENKNSKEYIEIIDDLIARYDKKGMDFKNIYNLPTGLKGILYYKLYGLEEKKYNIRINISKQVTVSLKNLPRKEYIKLYRIINILIDNAIEASSKSREKMINIEIYKEESNNIIIIDNSFKGKLDLNMINNKNYSTKGKGRGLGLYILKSIINDSKKISLEQKIYKNIFSSKIIIK